MTRGGTGPVRRRLDGRVLALVEGDITALAADAVVNPANSALVLGAGVAGAIARRGGPAIQAECDRIGSCPVGGAVITTGGALPARHVVHAVGPRMGEGDEDRKLGDAVRSALRVAAAAGLERVALPAISTGVFGFPLERCAEVSIGEARAHLAGETPLREVTFCLYGEAAFRAFQDALDRAWPSPGALIRAAAALLVDFDGTLADSEPAHFRCYDEAFALQGHRLDSEEYRVHWTALGEGGRGEARRHGLRGIDLEAIESEKARRFSALARTGAIPLYPDAARFLASLRGRAAAIASNTSADDVRAVLAAGGALDLAPAVVGGGAGARPKPAPDIFLRAAQSLGVDPRSCLAVEDTRKGLDAARAAGMRVVGVRRPHNRDQRWPDADGEVEGLDDLVPGPAAP